MNDSTRPGRFPMPAMALLFAAELVGLALLRSPSCLRFEGFACGDWGANLTAQDLVSIGLRPGVDFIYPYGLLSLLFGRVWFGLMGATPHAYFEAMLVGHVAVAIGLARFVAATGSRPVSIAMIGLMMPYLVPPTHSNFAHAMEAALLVHAMASHAQGRRSVALALVTLAALSKPSMAYVYGLLLVVLIVATGRRAAWRALAPAAITGAGVALVLAVIYGPSSVLATQLPGEAARLYEANDFGFFFGSGRRYWWPDGAGPRAYLGTQRGWWIAATVVLMIAGGASFARWVRRTGGGEERARLEIGWVAALLHAAFISLFFGNDLSWIYYSDVQILGVVAASGPSRPRRWAGWALVALGLLCVRGVPGEIRGQWTGLEASAELGGLYSTREAAREWVEARERWKGRRAVAVTWSGHAAIAGPGLEPDVRFFVMPGMDRSNDVRRLAEAISGASVVVIPTSESQSFHHYLTNGCPPLREALDGFRTTYEGRYVEVRERDSLQMK